MSGHALLSPSGAAAWMACPGKLAMERGLPDIPNDYSDEGTAAHVIAALCLDKGRAAMSYRGTRVDLGHRTWEVTESMCDYVQDYVDHIHSRITGFRLAGARDVTLLVEVRVNFSAFVGQPDSYGTSDAVIIVEWPDGQIQVDVNDLKYGRGILVEVDGNPQLLTYALGAYDQFSVLGDITTISMAIHQPRLNNYSEWSITRETLLEFGVRLGEAADVAVAMYNNEIPLVATPGEEQCRFCKARATCPALHDYVTGTVAVDFADPQALQVMETEKLDAMYPSLELVEIWTRGVRAEIERRALAGIPFANCKIVQGKRGNRAWRDPAQAEATLKSMRVRVDEMYETKLISPTAAERVLADSPKRWERLQALITQSDGPLSVAPMSDRRPAVFIEPLANEFDGIEELEAVNNAAAEVT